MVLDLAGKSWTVDFAHGRKSEPEAGTTRCAGDATAGVTQKNRTRKKAWKQLNYIEEHNASAIRHQFYPRISPIR